MEVVWVGGCVEGGGIRHIQGQNTVYFGGLFVF